ncbi:hypothetical protein MIR68_011850 [Amoeboaphelidium protococcarum]|nr:hypothetical protein MIR68_011850 [Amoeboaphelidium protococcarum]
MIAIETRSDQGVERHLFPQQSSVSIKELQPPQKVEGNTQLKNGAAGLAIKSCQFSANGRVGVFLHSQGLVIRRLSLTESSPSDQVVHFQLPNIHDYLVSPSGGYVAVYTRMKDMPQVDVSNGSSSSAEAKNNVKIISASDASIVASYQIRNIDMWRPQWDEQERFMVWRGEGNKALVSHSADGFKSVVAMVQVEGLQLVQFQVCPVVSDSNCVYIMTYATQLNNDTSAFIRMFQYDLKSNAVTLLGEKAVIKADQVTFKWSTSGQHCLALCTIDVDKSNKSYYGIQKLYLFNTQLSGNAVTDLQEGIGTTVGLDKVGPIHDFTWLPEQNKSSNFVVVYGNTPSSAGLYNTKGSRVFDFGQFARNTVRISPEGRFLLFGGYGNLAGYTQIWDLYSRGPLAGNRNLSLDVKLIAEYKEDSPIFIELSNVTTMSLVDGTSGSDTKGVCIVCATTFPRLRVDNRFRVRNIYGDLLWEKSYKELYQCFLVARPVGSSSTASVNDIKEIDITIDAGKLQEITLKKQQSANGQSNGAQKSGYVPPHLRKQNRGVIGASFTTPSNDQKKSSSLPSSNNAQQSNLHQDSGSRQDRQSKSKSQSVVDSAEKQRVEPKSDSSNGHGDAGGVSNEIKTERDLLEKKALGLQRKLRAIQQLHLKQASGITLEKNQIEKLKTEGDLQMQLHNVEQLISNLGK